MNIKNIIITISISMISISATVLSADNINKTIDFDFSGVRGDLIEIEKEKIRQKAITERFTLGLNQQSQLFPYNNYKPPMLMCATPYGACTMSASGPVGYNCHCPTPSGPIFGRTSY